MTPRVDGVTWRVRPTGARTISWHVGATSVGCDPALPSELPVANCGSHDDARVRDVLAFYRIQPAFLPRSLELEDAGGTARESP